MGGSRPRTFGDHIAAPSGAEAAPEGRFRKIRRVIEVSLEVGKAAAASPSSRRDDARRARVSAARACGVSRRRRPSRRWRRAGDRGVPTARFGSASDLSSSGSHLKRASRGHGRRCRCRPGRRGATTVGGIVAVRAAGIGFPAPAVSAACTGRPHDARRLGELARTEALVVSSGIKSLLDIPVTMEPSRRLASRSSDYARTSCPLLHRSGGPPLPARVESAEEAAELARTHWPQRHSALLLVQPPPRASTTWSR
jgi:hypothetical protein